MKIITYSQSEKFILTDAEYEEADSGWSENKPYYCQRLKTKLSPFFRYATPPKLELTHDLYVKINNGMVECDVAIDRSPNKKVFEVYEDDSGGNSLLRMKFLSEEQKEDYLKDLVSMEDYFNKQKAVESITLLKMEK